MCVAKSPAAAFCYSLMTLRGVYMLSLSGCYHQSSTNALPGATGTCHMPDEIPALKLSQASRSTGDLGVVVSADRLSRQLDTFTVTLESIPFAPPYYVLFAISVSDCWSIPIGGSQTRPYVDGVLPNIDSICNRVRRMLVAFST
jgi:hypothetical protein